MENLVLLKDEINQLLARYGVKFGSFPVIADFQQK